MLLFLTEEDCCLLLGVVIPYEVASSLAAVEAPPVVVRSNGSPVLELLLFVRIVPPLAPEKMNRKNGSFSVFFSNFNFFM